MQMQDYAQKMLDAFDAHIQAWDDATRHSTQLRWAQRLDDLRLQLESHESYFGALAELVRSRTTVSMQRLAARMQELQS
jgi:hypothetical protein